MIRMKFVILAGCLLIHNHIGAGKMRPSESGNQGERCSEEIRAYSRLADLSLRAEGEESAVSDGRQERVFQACQGYPFTRFGGLNIPANLSL